MWQWYMKLPEAPSKCPATLSHGDVVELNPAFDVDSRMARTAARLIHTILSEAARTR